MKKLLSIICVLIITQKSVGQQVYHNFEGIKKITFAAASGMLDSLISNPAPDGINSSLNCARYVRDTTLYDYLLLHPDTLLENITLYADDEITTPKITMKLYTTAPAGTTIQLQLGKKSDSNYPSGVYCEFIQVTTAENEWENVTFNFYQFPVGSTTLPDQVDKMVILIDPYTNNQHTVYFDDLVGPYLSPGVTTANPAEILVTPPTKLYQNMPNPAKNNTLINFQLQSPGLVSLELFDVLGNSISSILNKHMKSGIHSIPLETGNIPDGIYFYVLKTEETSRSMKLIVSK